MLAKRNGFEFGLLTLATMLAATTSAAAAAADQNIPAVQAAPQATQTAEAGAEGIQDIVVTAQRREQSLQSVPVAVAAFGELQMATRQLDNLGDIAVSTPGLSISNRNGIILPFLRGVGSTGTSVGTEASVTVYLDGVYFARLPGAFFSLQNLQRVEVLKGPQGTLFGRNASGGVIQLVTKDPTKEFQLKGSASYANLDTYEGSIYTSFGLGDNAAMDFSATGRKQNKGFGRNLVTGNKFGFDDHFLFNSKLLYEPGDDTRITLSGFYGKSTNSTARNAFPGLISGYYAAPFDPIPSSSRGFFDDKADNDQRFRATVFGGYARIQHDLSFARLTSISSYSQIKEHFTIELDYTERPDGIANLFTKTKQFTQEVQIGSLDNSNGLEWIAGLYYFRNVGIYNPGSFRGPFSPFGGVDTEGRQVSKSYAGYAQATYEVAPGLSVTGGLRYTKDDISADGRFLSPSGAVLADPPPASSGAKKVTYKLGLDYKFSPDAMIYASYSRGFKEGNFPILFYNVRPSRPEVLDAYEIGFKTDLLDRHLRINGAAFYYDLKDPQVQLIQNGALFVENAGGARVKGFELDVTAAPVSGLSLRGSLTYLDSKYTEFKNAPTAPPNFTSPYGSVRPVQTTDATGNRTPYAAKWTINAGFDYRFGSPIGEVTLSADYYHNSGYVFEPDNFLKQPAYDLFNGKIGVALQDNVSVSVFGKNLTNEKYITNATTNVGPSGYLYQPAPGRVYGVEVDFEF